MHLLHIALCALGLLAVVGGLYTAFVYLVLNRLP